MPRDGPDETPDLWAMAAELGQQFAGYKQRLAERNDRNGAHADGDDAAARDDDHASGGAGEEEVEPVSGDDVKGRLYDSYMRRRDERLRQGWLARMERKEAEVKAFWAQLELTGRAGGINGTGERPTTTDAGTSAGDEEGKTERNDDDDKKRSADAAVAPRRITGKKHARTRSFSSSTNLAGRNRPDVAERPRALSQEPPSSEPQQAAGDASRENRTRPAAGATTATSRPKAPLRRRNSLKVHGGAAKQTGSKMPRSLPRASSTGPLADVAREAVLPRADAAAPGPSRSDQQDPPNASSPPRPFVGGGAGAANAQTASPDSDRSEVVDAVRDGECKAKNTDVKKRGDAEVDTSSADKPPSNNPNGEITSDSDIESSYVYICKDFVGKHAVSIPQTLDASAAAPEFSAQIKEENAERTMASAGATAKEMAIATPNATEAPARESSGEFSFSGSGRIGRSPPSSGAPSCSSRDQSIERVLEADAALLRKKREKRADKSAQKTPGSASSRVSAGTARSPKETPRGFKRFLSFGKKSRTREVTVVIDYASPSVSSVADDDSGGWQSAGSIKPRMGSSDAASYDTDHGHTPRVCSLQSLVAASPAKSELVELVPQVKSPKAHRSFFSFRALNCGRG